MKIWGFLISVAEYDDCDKNLSFVHGDNECIRKGLTNGLRIPENQIITCDHNGYMKYSEFKETISEFSCQITSEDSIIVYFSGHGGGAPYSLMFSDEKVPFDDFFEMINKFAAFRKIFIIDSCYAGNSDLPESFATHPSNDLFNYARSGCAIFASSNESNVSKPHPEERISLYTYCFSAALCEARVHNGQIFLTDVAKDAANRVTYISRSYGIPDQQPVYKSQIPDGVVFQIAEMRVNNENIYTSNNSKYEICSTKILHSSIEMRYSITAILKDSAEDEKISLYTSQIVEEIKPIRRFKNRRQELRFLFEQVKVVFIYWGRSENDIIRGNWLYRSTWADPTSNRSNWYKTGKNDKVINDILVSNCPNYEMLNEMYQENVVTNKELIERTKTIADPVLCAANYVVRLFEEYTNGIIPERAFIQGSKDAFQEIGKCYFTMSRLPVPSVELKEWSDKYDCLIASIDDMRIYYTTKSFLSRDEKNRKLCMQDTVQRYQHDLQQLIIIEEKLKEKGIFPVLKTE